jgi:hypothetical protein
MALARVAARALNQKQVLTEFVAELFYFKIAHAADCAKADGAESIQ